MPVPLQACLWIHNEDDDDMFLSNDNDDDDNDDNDEDDNDTIITKVPTDACSSPSLFVNS